MRCAVVESPIGPLTLVGNGVGLREIRFGTDGRAHPHVPVADDPLLGRVAAQLERYFAGALQRFDIPLSWGDVTPFQQRVYEAMQRVPYGELTSYRDLAADAGSPRGSRAVGQACNRNPLPIVVPCHRIVAADGSLGGYGGGIEAKRTLLSIERPDQVPTGGWMPRRAARAAAPA